jgi:apolipoprotein N-acyltransferase
VALIFALAVVGARRVLRRHGAIAGLLAFAAGWTALDLVGSFGATGSLMSPSIAEAGAPLLIQGASLVGFLGITFLLGIVAAGLAISARSRALAPAALALGIFAANAGFGFFRVSAPSTNRLKVALVESDAAMVGNPKDEKRTRAVVGAYAEQVERLRDDHVQLIVLPENISSVAPAWRNEIEARLAAAADAAGGTVVAGFNLGVDGAQRNVALAFVPKTKTPVVYAKRCLIPVLETSMYAPGAGPRVLPSGVGLEICKDMDFQTMIRRDEAETQPQLLAVPAWDFGQDAWFHCRSAILRSVESGVPMARNARRGLLTLNDRYGRVVAQAKTSAGFTTLIADLPLDGRGGGTLYDRIGDSFGWLCIVLGAGLIVSSFLRPVGAD